MSAQSWVGRAAGGGSAGRAMSPDASLPQHPRVAPLTVGRLLAGLAPEAYSVDVEATVLDALQVMAEHEGGAVPVLDGKALVGLFSETAHARAGLHDEGLARLVPVRERMLRSFVVATPGQSVPVCLARLKERKLHHLPVLENGVLLGVLSRDDLLEGVVSHCERVFAEMALDQRVLFLRGTYSC